MELRNIPFDEFLKPFFEPHETVCLRVFDDRKTGTFKGAKLECQAGKIASVEDTLRKHNAQNRGIYFVINYGGHEDSDITRINAQFVECDRLSIDEQYAQVEAFALPPSLIVRTKKSLHCYWLMRSAQVENFRDIQKRLVSQFNGDPACVNESRVFRLPGFHHCKGDPVMVECIKFSPELRYTQAELDAVLPKSDNESNLRTPVNKGNRRGLTTVVDRCLFLHHCKENSATLSEHDWYSMISNLAVFDGGDDMIHTLSKDYPSYSYNETQSKIAHFLSSGTKPITCSTIAEKGFRCPRLADGSCSCKAPAALCYVPMTVDELIEILHGQPINPANVHNMQTAKDFISDYLYNCEPVLAETFINYEMKAYFRLKSADLKPLIAMYKDTYKKYTSNRETRRETSGGDLPEWYEVTDGGGLHFLPGLLAEHMAHNVNVFYAAEQYHIYRNGVYMPVSDLEAKSVVRSHLISRCTVLSHITDAEGQWRMLIIKPLREVNSNPYIINTKNGLYNVLTDNFTPHTPDYLSTIQLNARYIPEAKCPRFVQFLNESLEPDEIPVIQEMLGYFLIPVNKAQKSFIIVGEPGAGKSKLLLTLNQVLLGQQNVSNIAWQNLDDRFKTAELYGKLANIFADLPSTNIEDNGIFKALAGEDFLTVEKKNKDPFSFQPTTRLLFSCNSMPRNFGDKSDGFYRKLTIIRFRKALPPEKRDAELMEKFIAEADGIIMFAIEGLKRLIANGYHFSETVGMKEELHRYKIDSNSVLSFIDDCCKVAPDSEIERNELYRKYREYCISGGLSPFSQKAFNKDLETAFPEIQRSVDKLGRRRTWKGIETEE